MVENYQPDSAGARPPRAAFEYSRPAFHAIQETVLDGYGNSPRGREEEAGILYGTREGNIIRVQVARRIACEHARGRTFLLSAKDRSALKEQLTREATELATQGLAVVGWFLSHAAPIRTVMTTSGRTVLSSADLQTFDEYFRPPGQVTLVLRPHASTTIQASVFARRDDGNVNAEESDLNFPFTESAAVPDRAKGVVLKHPNPSAPAVRETGLAAAATMAATVSVPAARQTVPTSLPAPSPSAQAILLAPTAPFESGAPDEPATPAIKGAPTRASVSQPRILTPDPVSDRPASVRPVAPRTAKGGRDTLPVIRGASLPDLKLYPNFGSYSDPAPWFTFESAKFLDGLWGIVVLALLAGLASMPLGVRYYRSLPEATPISLTIAEHNSQIQVRWNHFSRVIREAKQGSIEFLDGHQSRSAALSADDLSHGSIIYMRQTGDVQIRLEVEGAKGQKTQEVTHFIERHP